MDAGYWDERYLEQELVWSAEPNALVVAEVVDLRPGRALDLATGEGRNAMWLAECGWKVEGVDYSEVAISKARRLAEGRGLNITWTTADLTQDPPAFEPADLVLIAYLQLPLREATQVLRLAASLVTAGGTLVLVCHARSNLERGYGGPQDPDVLRTLEEVMEPLADTGLAVERGDEVTRTLDTEGGPRDAIDLVVRATRPIS